jgi:hypothetical protein
MNRNGQQICFLTAIPPNNQRPRRRRRDHLPLRRTRRNPNSEILTQSKRHATSRIPANPDRGPLNRSLHTRLVRSRTGTKSHEPASWDRDGDLCVDISASDGRLVELWEEKEASAS